MYNYYITSVFACINELQRRTKIPKSPVYFKSFLRNLRSISKCISMLRHTKTQSVFAYQLCCATNAKILDHTTQNDRRGVDELLYQVWCRLDYELQRIKVEV